MPEIAIHGGAVALVDLEDVELVSAHKWYMRNGYAVTAYHVPGSKKGESGRTANVYMHRLLMGPPPEAGLHVDHVNRDRLDNRRSNLRWVTPAQNSQNAEGRSGLYKGVKKDDARWAARLRGLHLGSFATPEEAAKVYDKAARHFFGDYAALNFPNEHYEGQVRYVDFIPDKMKPKSAHTGVSYFGHGGKRVKRWRAVYRKRTLGYFATEHEAAAAYQEAKNEGS